MIDPSSIEHNSACFDYYQSGAGIKVKMMDLVKQLGFDSHRYLNQVFMSGN